LQICHWGLKTPSRWRIVLWGKEANKGRETRKKHTKSPSVKGCQPRDRTIRTASLLVSPTTSAQVRLADRPRSESYSTHRPVVIVLNVFFLSRMVARNEFDSGGRFACGVSSTFERLGHRDLAAFRLSGTCVLSTSILARVPKIMCVHSRYHFSEPHPRL